MDPVIYKRRDMYIVEAFYTKNVVAPLLPALGKTHITPNMITIFNIALSFLTYYFAAKGNLTLTAILIQVYLFLDILDGNLARYKNMHTELGKILDNASDRIFYNLIIITIGYGRVHLGIIVLLILLINLNAIIPTYYIVPRLKRLKEIKRVGIKRIAMEKGYILGMDLSIMDALISIFLLINQVKYLFIILIIGYIFDLIYRIIELKYNEKLLNKI